MKRILVAVDVSNLYYTVKKKFNGARVDYEKLREYCSIHGEIYRMLAFASQMQGAGDKFLECLRFLNYKVFVKDVKEYVTKPIVCPHCSKTIFESSKRQKADWDVGMAIEILRYDKRTDVVILCTADGDMAPLVKYLQEHGIFVIIIGCNISSELRELADVQCEISPSFLEGEKNETTNPA